LAFESRQFDFNVVEEHFQEHCDEVILDRLLGQDIWLLLEHLLLVLLWACEAHHVLNHKCHATFALFSFDLNDQSKEFIACCVKQIFELTYGQTLK
jgi:hypothetical protein